MRHVSAALLGALILSTAVSTVTTPASALGGCGPNQHRNPAGYCVWGGQRQDWCWRHTGHVAAFMYNGTRRCF